MPSHGTQKEDVVIEVIQTQSWIIFTPVRRPEKPAVSTHSLTRCVRHPEQFERQAEFPSSDKTRPDSPVPTLQGPCGRSPKRRGSLRFLPPLEVRPSSVALWLTTKKALLTGFFLKDSQASLSLGLKDKHK